MMQPTYIASSEALVVLMLNISSITLDCAKLDSTREAFRYLEKGSLCNKMAFYICSKILASCKKKNNENIKRLEMTRFCN